MADQQQPAADGEDAAAAGSSMFSSLAAWGGAAWSAAANAATEAANSARSLLGMEDLAVVDPTAAGSTTGGGEASTAHDARRAAAFADFARYVGADITSLVSLPVWIMEPYTLLQKVAEIMEYSDALATAVATDDEYERMAWVAGFCLGPFGGNERTWKPFNPILGETFQVDCGPGKGRFLAEQVCHHPPIGAARAEGPGWSYEIVSAPATRFLGNAVDIFPRGRTRIVLEGRGGETYSLSPPNSKAHNLIVGRTWVDCYGDFRLTNLATGAVCALAFTPCGWFGAGRYEVAGHIADAAGAKRLAVSGAWNSHLDVTRCDPESGEPLPGAGKTRVWACAPKPDGDKFGFTHFARKLCDGCGINPLPSDSRRRPDRAALEAGDQRAAGAHKHALEEAQRAERRAREEKGGEDGAWKPRWFRAVDAKTAAERGYLHENDADPADCPVFEWAGDMDAAWTADDGGDAGGGAPSCSGRGFNPWQFPDLHTELKDYEAPPLPPPADGE